MNYLKELSWMLLPIIWLALFSCQSNQRELTWNDVKSDENLSQEYNDLLSKGDEDKVYVETMTKFCGIPVSHSITPKKSRTEQTRDTMQTWGTRFIIWAPVATALAIAASIAFSNMITVRLGQFAFLAGIGVTAVGVFLVAASALWYILLFGLLVGGIVMTEKYKGNGFKWEWNR